MAKYNLDDFEDDFDEGGVRITVPPGVYPTTVKSAIYEKSPKERLQVDFEITDGEYRGVSVRNWFYLHTPDSKRISLEQLSVLGMPPKWSPANARQLVGRECKIVTDLNDTGQYANVKYVYQRDIPPGVYNTVVTEATKEVSRNDKEYIKVRFSIRSDDEFHNMVITDTWYLTDKSIPYTLGKVKRLGITGNFDDTKDLNKLIGKKATLTTAASEGSDGRIFTRVMRIEAFDGDLPSASNVSSVSNEADAEVLELDVESVAGLDSFDEGFEEEGTPY